ncbi:hypothetical protein ACFP1Z_07930 [Streptomyces gamaensis]|uniref:ATP-binding protein n=1 Tax=Streptomyces gamaensis TaxID=1763542 RepID=A0ABW0YU58_9ACTN
MPDEPCPFITPGRPRHPHPTPYRTATPTPEGLAYSFTVPGEARYAPVVRANVLAALRVHSIRYLAEPVLHVVTELLACGVAFAPGHDLYQSLRWSRETLRIVNWDPHGAHPSNPDAERTCEAGRRRQLLFLSCLVRECKGEWGITAASPSHEGTKVWVELPESGAMAYIARHG